MDKQQAQRIIKETFESPFGKNRFVSFIRNLLNKIEVSTFIYKGNYIPDAYKPYIKTLERIGKFNDGESEIDILIVTLKKDTSLERARTMQRNFIAWYLNGSRGGNLKDGALVAFVSPEVSDWRFSLIKMDYKYEQSKSGKMKVKEEFTPARRWSFLVGLNEKSHTAQSRLVDILANDEQDPTLQEIEQAFDIETVTKEFFIEYRRLFLLTKEELDRVVENNPKVEAEFESKSVDTVNFAKKLLGQIVFLYFLQKKGWFGVGRDEDWGNGSKQFLRELFVKKHGSYNNFFNDILEPLFYEALRIDRSHDDHYYSRFNCKIPFLNGGLFDPLGNYDWVHTDINLPNKLFSNSNKTIEGDIGNGILDVFDRFNFTVKEDEPLEKEVAIDPELLGKAYEKFNAIRPDNYAEFKAVLKSGKSGEENKFNKKFGVYYTPREIVHYMCQQSLINYLTIELAGKVKKEDIEALIQIGEHVTENEADALVKEKLIQEGKQKTTKSKLILSESIRENAEMIDRKLVDITVCDPAVGSGAFPVGMMNEIVRARNVLSTFLQDEYRDSYSFKRQCIENSLYGVDIDPGAAEIAKLRLWLSLVVDENDIKNIKPLPNLDYRIMQGNSLISEFMGINFDSDVENKTNNLLFKDEIDELVECFQQKKDEFLKESNVSRKSELKDEVNDLLINIFESKLKIKKADYFKQLKNINNKYSGIRNEEQRNELIEQEKEILFKKCGLSLKEMEKQLKEFTSGKQIKPFFLWKLYFSEVFHNKGGFDVIIANPPYIDSENMVRESPMLRDICVSKFKSAKGNWDLFIVFIEQGINLLRNNGVISYIVPNKLIGAKYSEALREILICRNIKEIRDYSKVSVFKDVSVYPVTFIIVNNNYKEDVLMTLMDSVTSVESSRRIAKKIFYSDIDWARYFVKKKQALDILDKLSRHKPLKTFFQKVSGAMTVSEAYSIKKLIKEDNNRSNNKKLINTGTIDPYISLWGIKKITYIKSTYEKPIVSDSDLKKLNINRYYQACSEKIIIGGMNKRLECFYDNGKYVAGKSTTIILPGSMELKYLVAVLNSKLISFWYKTYFKSLSLAGGFIRIGNNEIKKIPLIYLDLSQQKPIVCLVNQIIAIILHNDYFRNPQKQEKVKELKREIDQLIYQLYELTPEEIKTVEEEYEDKSW